MKLALYNLVILCVLFFPSCKSIIEEDLGDKKVIINSPTSSQLESYSQTFWWEKMDGAIKYQVQIVTTSFDDIQKLIVDTLVTGNKLTHSFDPGDYEWRIRGVNGSYQSEYSGSKFSIVESDITKQFVLLASPDNNGFTSLTPMKVTWVSLFGVDGYRVQIDKNNSFTTALTLDASTPNTNYTTTLTEETTYYWRVRAFKDTDSSKWSSINSFTYDITPPDQVVLKTPANNLTDINAATGLLTWTSLGAGIRYIVHIQYGSSTETQSSPISSTSYSYSGTSGQTVKWRVESIDAADNKGVISTQWQFKIQ